MNTTVVVVVLVLMRGALKKGSLCPGTSQAQKCQRAGARGVTNLPMCIM